MMNGKRRRGVLIMLLGFCTLAGVALYVSDFWRTNHVIAADSNVKKQVSIDRDVLHSEKSGSLRKNAPSAAASPETNDNITARHQELSNRRDAQGLFELGKEIEEKKPQGWKEQARGLFEEAAALGHRDAKFESGRYAEAGWGQKVDAKKALRYYDEVGDGGDPRGYIAAARMLAAGRALPADLLLANSYIDKAITLGSAEGLYLKGALLVGKSEAETKRGLAFLLQAAEAGDAEAQMLIGRFYREGTYVMPDEKLAKKWAESAANNGLNAAQVDLANQALKENNLTGQDQRNAIERLLVAAENNDPKAAIELAMMFGSLRDATAEDLNTAREYAQIAYNNGQPKGAFLMAASYNDSESDEALKWLKKGAQSSDWRSRYAYGLITNAGLSIHEAIQTASRGTFADFIDFTMVKNTGSSKINPPMVISAPMPAFPQSLKGLAIKDEVKARFIVNQEGIPINIEIQGASHPQTADAVRQAVSKWRFKPALKGGVAVPMKLQVPVRFSSVAAK